MRQCCELCEALGADSARGHKLIGVVVGSRDALLCADHALFALDSDVASIGELRELFEFVATVEPRSDEVAVRRSSRSAAARGARSVL
jgi:hypothetical protein